MSNWTTLKCKNSMSGKHELPDQIGKNKGKKCCKYCSSAMFLGKSPELLKATDNE